MGNSGSLYESYTSHWSPSKKRSKILGLQKVPDSVVLSADETLGLKSVNKGEIVSSRQTRSWLKKQTSFATVFKMHTRKSQGTPVPAYAHISKLNSGGAKANS